MSKIAHYLQEHLLGEVTASSDIRQHFAHDSSVMEVAPTVVVYPRNESDIRKTVRFAWQLAQRGKILPITARGGGTSTSGSAIGSGAILSFVTHMNRVEELNIKKRSVIVQPGMTYTTLEHTLNSHELFLPASPSLPNYATVGGGIACNSVGQNSLKYGCAADSVQSLRVVLSDGEIIDVEPLDKKALNTKLGLQTMEGEIYRSLDKLLEENTEFIERGCGAIKASYNSAGYNLFDIKKNNKFDLCPLFIGSEGTLGIITEATLSVTTYNPKRTLGLISLDEVADLYEVLPRLLELKPSLLDFLTKAAIDEIKSLNPTQLNGIALREEAAIHLFVEFDDSKEVMQKKSAKQLQKIVEKVDGWCEIAEEPQNQELHNKLRESLSTFLIQTPGKARAIPVAEDICVPVDKLVEFLSTASDIYSEVGLPPAVWGQAGSGIVHTQPVLDLSQTGDRQKLFKLQDSLYSLAIKLGGSISAGNGDGRIRAPYLSEQYGEELYQLMLRVKKIFDPYNILNPGVKTATAEEVKSSLRNSYDISRFADHLPRN